VINARRMRHVIKIQRRGTTQDEDGHFTDYEDFIDNVRADIHPLSGREWIAAQQTNADVNTRITVRYRPDIEPTQRALRLTNEGDSPATYEIYDIEAVLPDPDSGHHYLTLMCTRRTTEGFRRGDAP
jgi:SPP1 family predicted phage head-tail adaptor